MYVCESCHEKDRNAIKCKRSLKEHAYVGIMACSMCGKFKNTVLCYDYREYIHNKEKVSVPHIGCC